MLYAGKNPARIHIANNKRNTIGRATKLFDGAGFGFVGAVGVVVDEVIIAVGVALVVVAVVVVVDE